MPGHKTVAKNTAFQYGLQIAKYIFPFITIPYLTRVLGADVYAIRAYNLAVMSLMAVFLDFGFLNYGTKAIAEAKTLLEQQRITSEITLLRVGLCLIGGIILIPLGIGIPILTAYPLYLVLAYLGTCLKAFLPDFIFQGKEDMGIMTNRFVVSQAVCVVLIIVFVNSPDDLLLVPIFEALANLIALAWSWQNAHAVHHIALVRIDRTSLMNSLKTSGVFFIASASTTILSSFTTICIGIFIEDRAQVSYWSIAMTAIVAVQALYAPVTNALYPHMVKTRDFAFLKKLLMIGMPIVIVGTIAFAMLSDLIMLILGGREFLEGSYVIAMVAPMLSVSFPAVMLGLPVLGAVGWIKQLTTTSVIAAVVQITGLILLAATNMFTIEAVAILRCMSEARLCLGRVIFVAKLRRSLREETAAA